MGLAEYFLGVKLAVMVHEYTDLIIMVTPHATRSQVIGWHENMLKVKIRGIPEKGQVNRALIDFLANILGISKSRITLIRGVTSRKKTVRIHAMTKEQVHTQFIGIQ